jgi:hypothetical protein
MLPLLIRIRQRQRASKVATVVAELYVMMKSDSAKSCARHEARMATLKTGKLLNFRSQAKVVQRFLKRRKKGGVSFSALNSDQSLNL